MSDEKICQIALGLTSGVGGVLTRQLISYCGSASVVFKSTKGKLLKIPGIGPKTADALLRKEVLLEAEQEWKLTEKQGVRLLFYTDKQYPTRLKNIEDAPPLLYYKGEADLNSEKIVSIVGTRQATAYGKSITEEIVSDLSKFKSLLVLSGLAYGIDVAAHKAALKQSVPTIGVMANGIDIVYPAAHRTIASQMLEQGGLLTENRIGTKPDAPKFPARNRIIAGLADVLIVVEAAATGGALITAEIANSYNKDVFAVPGKLGEKYSLGCNHLIKTHKANIFTSVKDLEYLMNWQEKADKKETVPLKEYTDQTPETQQIVLLLQQNKTMLIDELSWQSQVPLGRLATLLLNLELQGIVKVLPGKKFTLC